MYTIFIKAVIAGICISIGGTVFLSVENTVAGAFLFSVGLFTVCFYQYNLFTGKVGYIPLQKDKLKYSYYLIVIWIGNLIGAFVSGMLVNMTRLTVNERAAQICSVKLGDRPLSLFILAFFCGILMYIAVEAYKRGNFIGIFICVTVFICSGFEHCVADMFYFSAANVWSLKTLLYTVVMSLGNAAGSILMCITSNLKET